MTAHLFVLIDNADFNPLTLIRNGKEAFLYFKEAVI